MVKFHPVVLIILDGWGLAPKGAGNAVALANTPNMARLVSSYPNTQLLASGEAVGLPHGEDGNTETGHLNIGAGFIVYQDLPRINLSIADGSFFQNTSLLAAINHTKIYKSKLHIMGLIGSGGVHSNIEHLFALMNLGKQQNVKNLYLHLFTDGRDSPPKSSPIYINEVEEQIKKIGIGKICSLIGRYYAMDRDNRWERTEKAYNALVNGLGETANNSLDAVNKAYEKGETDEFIDPTLILDENGNKTTIGENDAVIFFNYRVDRPRQLTKAFILPDLKTALEKQSFDPYAVKYYKKHLQEIPHDINIFNRETLIKNLFFVTLTEYETGLPALSAYPPEKIKHPLGKILSEHNLRQLHMSESEKERFVTYYLNGQREGAFSGEDDVIIPSSKVATYDLKPEMSSYELTDSLIQRLESRIYDFIIINYANPDMVAHTGVLNASIKACEVADYCLGKVARLVIAMGGAVIITGDHGNAEELLNKETGEIDTEHSTAPVPFIAAAHEFEGLGKIPSGILADIAPTVLYLLGIDKPGDMSGRNLLQNIIKNKEVL